MFFIYRGVLIFNGMKKIILLPVILCALFLNGLCQKIEGPVLKKELVGKYEGHLQNGLAQGKGVAQGLDTYTGNFRKGLPNGEGVYTDYEGNVYKGSFVNGYKEGKGELTVREAGKEMILKGYWESDKYVGLDNSGQYEVSNKTGSVTPRIFSAGAGNKVEITIIDPVTFEFITGSILVKGDANLRTTFGRYYYEDAAFPIEFDIQYNCNNKIGTSITANTIRIRINKPGYWIITLRN
jgi:hypothetical protein